MKTWLQRGSLTLQLACLTWTIIQLGIDLQAVDLVYYNMWYLPTSLIYLVPGGLIGLLLSFTRFHRELESANRPLLLLGFLLILPWHFCFLPLTIMTLTWAFYRNWQTFALQLPQWFSCPARLPLCGAVALTVLAAGWAYFLQIEAFSRQFLLLGDWGQYAQCYLKIAFAPNVNPVNYLVAAGHWNPAINLIMSGLIRLFPTPHLIFAVNAIILSSAIILGYLLARTHKISPALSALIALLIALNPAYSQQPLSLFYGFHPINFFIPTLLLFFIFRQKQLKWGMISCFIFSLFIQETVAVFWGGYALYELYRKKWKRGGILLLGCALFFLFISQVVIPPTDVTQAYAQNFHYAALGSNLGEILLSPFRRPQAFWGIVFQESNLNFILLLIVPFAAILKPWSPLLLSGLPLLGGILLQESPDLKTIVLQYAVELTTLLVIVTIYQLSRRALRERLTVAAALLFGALLSYFYFGLTPWGGKYSCRRIFALPQGEKVMQYFRAAIPDGKRVITTLRLLPQLLFDYPCGEIGSPRQNGDYYLLDLGDPVFTDSKKLEALRRLLAADSAVRPLKTANLGGRQIVLLAHLGVQAPHYCHLLPQIAETQLSTLGIEVPVNDPHFRVRLFQNAQKKFQLVFYLQREVSYDVDVQIAFQSSGQRGQCRTVYGDGLYPAYTQKSGTIWLYPLPVDNLAGLRIELTPRSDSAVNQ